MRRFVVITFDTHGEDATRKVAQAFGSCYLEPMTRPALETVMALGDLARVHGIEVQEGPDEPEPDLDDLEERVCALEHERDTPPWPSLEESLNPSTPGRKRAAALAAKIHKESKTAEPEVEWQPSCKTCGGTGYAPHVGDPANGPDPCQDCGPF